MAPTLFIKFDFEAPRRAGFIIGRIAPGARRSGTAAVAGALALEWAIWMVLANPSAVLTDDPLYRSRASFRFPQ
jgi:hypothetical protein